MGLTPQTFEFDRRLEFYGLHRSRAPRDRRAATRTRPLITLSTVPRTSEGLAVPGVLLIEAARGHPETVKFLACTGSRRAPLPSRFLAPLHAPWGLGRGRGSACRPPPACPPLWRLPPPFVFGSPLLLRVLLCAPAGFACPAGGCFYVRLRLRRGSASPRPLRHRRSCFGCALSLRRATPST